mmetsp:Transcript_24872/g.45036  ORF Transcript_24872/g.45036 Transcript_24872/m.45036 type:complete len:214 (-) Transcript_24872:879-1520(-)
MGDGDSFVAALFVLFFVVGTAKRVASCLAFCIKFIVSNMSSADSAVNESSFLGDPERLYAPESTVEKSRINTDRGMPRPICSHSFSRKATANVTKQRRSAARRSRSEMVTKPRSTIRPTELAKLLEFDASSRFILHCCKRALHVGDFKFQLRLPHLNIPPANRTANGELPQPLTMKRASLNTAEFFPPYGRRPAEESNSFTASCSEKIRTKTS